jgi:PAS domain S-box-containing protein
MRLSIKTRLVGGFVVILIATVILGLSGIRITGEINRELGATREEQFVPSRMIATAHVALLDWSGVISDHLLTGSAEEAEELEHRIVNQKATVIMHLVALSELEPLSQRGRRLISKLEDGFSEAQAVGAEVLELSRRGQKKKAQRLLRGELEPLVRRLGADMTEFLQLEERGLNARIMANDERYQRGVMQILGIMLVTSMVLFVICFLLIRLISGSVGQLIRGAEEITRGNLDRRTEVTHTLEFGQLARALNSVAGERKRVEEALRASEAKYRAISDSSNHALFIHDPETGEILDVNKKMCEMYGYSPEEVRSINVETLSSGEPPYTQKEALRWIRKAAAGEPQLFEWLAKDKEGRLFWVEVNLKRAVLGDRERLLAIVRDLTERKEVEDPLQREQSDSG